MLGCGFSSPWGDVVTGPCDTVQGALADSLYPNGQPVCYPEWFSVAKSGEVAAWQSKFAFFAGHLQQCDVDDLFQLGPYLLVAKPLSEARKLIGKAHWKIAHKSTARQNAMRVLIHQRNPSLTWAQIFSVDPKCLSDVARVARGAPRFVEAALFAGRNTGNGRFKVIANYYLDAMQMGVSVNDRWSVGRLIKEHDKAAERISVGDSSSVRFASRMVCHIDGFRFERLVSERAIKADGYQQRHCVGAYAPRAASGRLLLFQVDGPARATLSLVRKGKKWEIWQFYGFANRRVSKSAKAAGQKLVWFVNRYGVRA